MARLTPEGRFSVPEEWLRGWLDEHPARPVVVVDVPRHGGDGDLRSWREPDAPAAALDAVEPETASFAGLLEAGAGHLARAKAAHLAQCRAAAVQARALAAFAAARPAAVLDRPDAEVGAAAAASRAGRPAVLTPVSEWAVDEVMVALGLSSDAASRLVAESITLVERLPATLNALETGTVSWAHARMLAEVLAPLADDHARAEVESRLLARSAGRTVSQLRVAARRAVLRADASAAVRRLAAAVRDRAVRAYPGEDGMGTLSATMPMPLVRACTRVLEAYAEQCAVPGDERTKDQRMVDCLIDLLLRPDAAGRPPVQAQLTIVAGVNTLTGGDEPGEIDGQPVPALLVRELAHALGILPRPEFAEAVQSAATTTRATTATPATAKTAGPETAGPDTAEPDTAEPDTAEPDTAEPDTAEPDTAGPDTAGPGTAEPETTTGTVTADRAVAAGLADLFALQSTAGTSLTELPTVAVVDEVSGQLLALTSPTEIRRVAACHRTACRTGRRACTHPPAGPGLGPPADSPGYRPSQALQRFVRARDRRCRFPGCRARAERCDLDHNTPWPAGATSCDNLCCLCRHHHRLSHQAPGWTMRRLPDGRIEWTTPSGDRLTTHPPRYGTDDDLPPPKAAAPAAPTLRESVLGRPATPEEREDAPPPF